MKRKIWSLIVVLVLMMSLSACVTKEAVESSGTPIKGKGNTRESVTATMKFSEPEISEEVEEASFGLCSIPDTGYTKVVRFHKGVEANILGEFVGWHLNEDSPYVDIAYMIENCGSEGNAFTGSVVVGGDTIDISTPIIASGEVGYFLISIPIPADKVDSLKENSSLELNVISQGVKEDDLVWIGNSMTSEWRSETDEIYLAGINSYVEANIVNFQVVVFYMDAEYDTCYGMSIIEGEDIEPLSSATVVVQKSDIPEYTENIVVVPYGCISQEEAADLAAKVHIEAR